MYIFLPLYFCHIAVNLCCQKFKDIKNKFHSGHKPLGKKPIQTHNLLIKQWPTLPTMPLACW